MIEAVKYNNDNGIINLKLSRIRYIDRNNIYSILTRYLTDKESYFIYKKCIEYKECTVEITSKRTIIFDDYQAITISSNNTDLIEELKSILVLNNSESNNFVTILIPIATRFDKKEKISVNKTVPAVLDLYRKKYFTSNEDYIDILLGIQFKKIKRAIINAIDTISDIPVDCVKIYDID